MSASTVKVFYQCYQSSLTAGGVITANGSNKPPRMELTNH